MYSVLILTKNEEKNIRSCLESVDSDDKWVLDSGSDDSTVQISENLGAKVIVRSFDNYANQRNFGLSLNFKHDWILMLDADEQLPEKFKSSIKKFLTVQPVKVGMISVLRRDYFLGRWLRGASGYPVYFPRIFRKGCVKVKRDVNELYVTDQENIKVNSYIEHFPFNSGVTHWVNKHNTYSSMEAEISENSTSHIKDNYTRRRAQLKGLFYKLPMRPFIMFIYLYIFKRGFLAGRAGFYFCFLRMFYETLINIKRIEIDKKN